MENVSNMFVTTKTKSIEERLNDMIGKRQLELLLKSNFDKERLITWVMECVEKNIDSIILNKKFTYEEQVMYEFTPYLFVTEEPEYDRKYLGDFNENETLPFFNIIKSELEKKKIYVGYVTYHPYGPKDDAVWKLTFTN